MQAETRVGALAVMLKVMLEPRLTVATLSAHHDARPLPTFPGFGGHVAGVPLQDCSCPLRHITVI